MRGKHVLMDTLEAHGVELLFGNPGTTESPIIDALVDRPRLRYIMALHEAVAVGAAHYYAQASGKTGVVNLHVAPGLGNALGMLYNAWEANTPLLVTAGQQDTRMRLREPLLGHDLAGHGRAPHQVERAGGARRRDGAGAAPRPQDRAGSAGGSRLRGPAHRRPRAGRPRSGPCRPAGSTAPASPIRPGWRPRRSCSLGSRHPVIAVGDGVARARAQDGAGGPGRAGGGARVVRGPASPDRLPDLASQRPRAHAGGGRRAAQGVRRRRRDPARGRQLLRGSVVRARLALPGRRRR